MVRPCRGYRRCPGGQGLEAGPALGHGARSHAVAQCRLIRVTCLFTSGASVVMSCRARARRGLKLASRAHPRDPQLRPGFSVALETARLHVADQDVVRGRADRPAATTQCRTTVSPAAAHTHWSGRGDAADPLHARRPTIDGAPLTASSAGPGGPPPPARSIRTVTRSSSPVACTRRWSSSRTALPRQSRSPPPATRRPPRATDAALAHRLRPAENRPPRPRPAATPVRFLNADTPPRERSRNQASKKTLGRRTSAHMALTWRQFGPVPVVSVLVVDRHYLSPPRFNVACRATSVARKFFIEVRRTLPTDTKPRARSAVSSRPFFPQQLVAKHAG